MKVIKFLKKLRYQYSNRRLLSDQFDVPRSSVMLPHGIRIQFRVGAEPRRYVAVGEKCLIDAEFIFESKSGQVQIGDNVHIGGATFICRSGITIGNDVTMAWGITLYDHDSHSIQWAERQHDNHQCYVDFHSHGGNNIVNKDWSNVKTKPITIHNKVWIGFDATVLKGVTIGEGAVIGAKSVVTKDVPAWSVVAGNPARVVKYLDQK